MEKNITITLEKARELYYSNNKTLIGIALQAFSPSELTFDYTTIKTFKDACDVFGIDHELVEYQVSCLKEFSRASAAMFKLNIIRKALNFNQDLYLTESPIWYPINPFLAENATHFRDKLKTYEIEVVGKIKNKGEIYEVIGGLANASNDDGLGDFCYDVNVGFTTASSGFLGCASEEIAKHFSKYFGMLITEAKYDDIVDFEIVERKYQ
nr:MAG TPA: hypothetical protein [Caudoviricetes sp.]